MDRLTRKELKTDKFALEVEHTVDWLSEHRPLLCRYGGIALAVLVVVLVVFGWQRYQRAERQKALQGAFAVQDAPVGEGVTGGGGPAFKTQPEKDRALLKAYQDLAARYPGTDEGQIASYFLATILADQGKTAEAEKGFRDVAGRGGLYGSLAEFALATMYQAQGKHAEAEKMLRRLAGKTNVLLSKEQVNIALARSLVKSNPTEARKLLETVQAESKDRTAPSRAAVNVLGEITNPR